MREFAAEIVVWVVAVARDWAGIAFGAVASIAALATGQGARSLLVIWTIALIVAAFRVWQHDRRQHLFTTNGREMFTDVMRAHTARMPQIFVTYHVDLHHGRGYAADLVAALIDAGWDAKIWRHPTPNLEINRRGIWVCGEPLDTRDLVITAFQAANVDAKIEPPQQPRFDGQPGIDITLGQIRFPIGQ